jgi:hypothetical protein
MTGVRVERQVVITRAFPLLLWDWTCEDNPKDTQKNACYAHRLLVVAEIPLISMTEDAALISAIALVQDANASPQEFVSMARLLFESSGGDMNDAMLDSARSRMAALGCGSAAVRGLANAIDNDSPWAVACLLLIRNMARDHDESAKLVHEYQAGQTILLAMSKFGKQVSKDACGALFNLSANKANRLVLLELGCAKAVAEAVVLAGPSDSRLVENGLGALANLAMTCQADPTTNALLMPCLSCVILGLQTHASSSSTSSRNARVGEAGLRFFGLLASLAENRIILAQDGAVLACLETMRALPQVPGITEWGCRLIRLVSQNKPDVKLALVRDGAAQKISQSLKECTQAKAAIQACAALWCLANHPQNKRIMLDSGAGEALIGAMRIHEAVVEVQIAGCAGLASLGNAGSVNKTGLVKAGAVAAVLQALRIYPSSVGVGVHGCACLWTLAINPTNKLVLLEASAHEVLLRTLRTHDKDHAVAVKALGALQSLAALPETSRTVFSKEVVTCVAQVTKLHLERADVCEHACGLLGNLAAHAEDKTVFNELGIPEVAISVQRVHKDDSQCAAEAERLLDCLWSESVVV